jgi:hypothetical protein
MNKRILNTTTTTAQKSNEQSKQKTKTLIINLGIATQLTLGLGGCQVERGPRAWQPPTA